jgi:hypothetical protein
MYVIVPTQLAGDYVPPCPGGIKQTRNGVVSCIYPCKPGEAPSSGCYQQACPENQQWDFTAAACRPICPVDSYWDEAKKQCGQSLIIPPPPGSPCRSGLVNVPDEIAPNVPHCVMPAEAERIKAERAAALKASQESPTQWIKVVGILAAIGVVGGLAWYSTRRTRGMKANNSASRVEYKVELANKIVRGRAVGNLWGVGTYTDGRRGRWLLAPQSDEALARRVATEANK